MSSAVAIMQPYFLPYLGYWHLMRAVDAFVIYDDIKYTKKGWINRNRFLINGKPEYFSLPLVKASDFSDIRERQISTEWNAHAAKYQRKLDEHYKNRRNAERGRTLFQEIAGCGERNLFDFLHHSIALIRQELKIDAELIVSSTLGDFTDLKGAERVKKICRELGAARYVNAIGGVDLYDKEDFRRDGLELNFVQSELNEYDQGTNEFVPGLSIMDLIYSISDDDEMERQLSSYSLI